MHVLFFFSIIYLASLNCISNAAYNSLLLSESNSIDIDDQSKNFIELYFLDPIRFQLFSDRQKNAGPSLDDYAVCIVKLYDYASLHLS